MIFHMHDILGVKDDKSRTICIGPCSLIQHGISTSFSTSGQHLPGVWGAKKPRTKQREGGCETQLSQLLVIKLLTDCGKTLPFLGVENLHICRF